MIRGPSGGGKTSLLNVLGTIDTATSGVFLSTLDACSLSCHQEAHHSHCPQPDPNLLTMCLPPPPRFCRDLWDGCWSIKLRFHPSEAAALTLELLCVSDAISAG